jgi:OOP family OmpA-OmpF porin
MRNRFSKQQAALTIACALAFGVFPSAASAQAMDINEKSLLMDSQGQPVRSADGKCVHSAFGPQPAWNAACHDPLPVAPLAQYVAPAAAPAAVAPDPVPAPVAAAPVVVVTENVTFDADVLFGSGKSDLRPAGRESLDAFIGKFQGLESQSIVAIGHADRMGSEASNQELSESRVDTVKSYLVSQGMSTDSIQTSAVGETQPTTATADCKEAKNQANIACLQADRRVMIEISGSRTAQ